MSKKMPDYVDVIVCQSCGYIRSWRGSWYTCRKCGKENNPTKTGYWTSTRKWYYPPWEVPGFWTLREDAQTKEGANDD